MSDEVDDHDDVDRKRCVHVEAILRCPDHGKQVLVLGVKTAEGASPRYLFACPEPTCGRMLLVIAQVVKETTLLAIDGKSIGTIP